MTYEITQLRNSCCVRPTGCLGTCGWVNGTAWQAIFFKNPTTAQRWIEKQTP